VIGIGAGVALTGLIPSQGILFLYAVNLLVGLAQVIANGPLTAIFQSAVSPDMQGRVFSLISAGATGMMPLSLLIAGPVSDLLGTRAWYLFGGITCIVVTLAAFSIPAIVNIEQNREQLPAE
jgi:DHA3 family macrolide efflux protein-like MFS transporter